MGGKRSRLGTGASGCGFAAHRRATMMRSSQQTHLRSQWRGGGSSPSPSSLEVQITSKSHLTQHSNNLYDKNKTHIGALQKKVKETKIKYICLCIFVTIPCHLHTRCIITKARRPKRVEHDSKETLFSHQLCGWYPTADHCEIVMSAFYRDHLLAQT